MIRNRSLVMLTWAGLLLLLVGCERRSATIEGQMLLEDESQAADIQVVLRGSVYTFHTRGDGRFRFDNVAPGSYDIVASIAGYHPVVIPNLAVAPGQHMILERRTLLRVREPVQVAAIEGYVSLQDRADSSGVQVELVGRDRSTVTPVSGAFAFDDLAPGTYTVRAWREGYDEATRDNIAVATGEVVHMSALVLMPHLPTAEELMQATETATLTGRVLCPGTLDFSGSTVGIEGTALRCMTRPDGRFELVGVPYGVRVVNVTHPLCQPFSRQVEVNAGDVTLDTILLKRFRPEQDAANRGALVGSVQVARIAGATAPVDLTRVFVEVVELGEVASADETGLFSLRDLPAGVYQLQIYGEGFQDMDVFGVTVRPGETTTVGPLLLMPLPPAVTHATLTGTVKIEGEENASGVMVSVSGTGSLAVTDAVGRYVLREVPSGVYDVQAHKEGYESGVLPGIEVLPGQVQELEPILLTRKQNRPRVLTTNPADGETRVAVDESAEVQITFSQDMDPGTVHRAVRIEPRVTFAPIGPDQLPGTGKRVFVFGLFRTDPAPLRLKTTYTVTIGSEASSVDGVTMEQPHSFTFTTGGPRIVRVYPADGAENVFFSADDYIYVETNAPVDLNTMRKAVTIRGARNDVVDLYRSPRRIGDRVMFNLTIGQANRRYRVTINSRLRTTDGKRFDNVPYTWSFTTQPEVVKPAVDTSRTIGQTDDDIFYEE